MDNKKSIIRLPATAKKTGLGRSSIYSKIADGSFPKPIKIGERAVGFIESEIDDWIEKKIQLRDGGVK